MSLRFKRNALLVDDDDSFKVGAENADFQTPLVVDQGTEDVNETFVADIEEVSLKGTRKFTARSSLLNSIKKVNIQSKKFS